MQGHTWLIIFFIGAFALGIEAYRYGDEILVSDSEFESEEVLVHDSDDVDLDDVDDSDAVEFDQFDPVDMSLSSSESARPHGSPNVKPSPNGNGNSQVS
jgi:hypothetical protein